MAIRRFRNWFTRVPWILEFNLSERHHRRLATGNWVLFPIISWRLQRPRYRANGNNAAFNVRAHRCAAYRAAARNQYDIIARFNEGNADSQQPDILDIVKLPVTDWSYSLTRPRYRCYKCSCRSNWIKVGQTECHKLHGESEREKR